MSRSRQGAPGSGDCFAKPADEDREIAYLEGMLQLGKTVMARLCERMLQSCMFYTESAGVQCVTSLLLPCHDSKYAHHEVQEFRIRAIRGGFSLSVWCK